VKLSDAEGELTLAAINTALKNAGVSESLDTETFERLNVPERNVRLKNHIGGPASEAVSSTIVSVAGKVEEHRKWYDGAAGKIQKAKEELEAIKRDVLAGS
jgi:hypothetical protein